MGLDMQIRKAAEALEEHEEVVQEGEEEEDEVDQEVEEGEILGLVHDKVPKHFQYNVCKWSVNEMSVLSHYLCNSIIISKSFNLTVWSIKKNPCNFVENDILKERWLEK